MSAFTESIAAPKPRRQTSKHQRGTTRRRTSAPSVASEQSALVARLDQLGDGCVVVAVLVVPMMSACLQDLGNAIFVACSLLLGVSWAVPQIVAPRQGSAASGAELIVFAAIAVVCLQLVPLSGATLKAFSPFADDYLFLWGSERGRVLGGHSWNTLSITPSLTRSGLVLLIAYALFFLVLVQKLTSAERVDQLIRLVAVAAAVMAVIGIAQRFAGNGLFLWMFEHPFRAADFPVKAAFSNQNHFAHFVSLGVGPLIWCWHQSNLSQQSAFTGKQQQTSVTLRRSETTRNAALFAIAIVCLAVFLTNSRGGILVFLLASGVAASVAGLNLRMLVKLIIPALLFAGLGILAYGTDGLEHKWNTITRAQSLHDLSQGRFALWASLVEAIPHFWKLGSGVGSHAEVYPTWLTEDFGVRFSHAESGYLQILLETGIAGLTLVAGAIGLCVYWVIGTFRRSQGTARSRSLILVAGLVASVAHSFVDFVWYIPGCMLVTIVLMAALCRNFQLSDTSSSQGGESRWPQALAWGLVLCMLPVGKLSADVAVRDAASEDDWNLYRKFAIHANDNVAADSPESLNERLDVIIQHLENCLNADPQDYRSASNLAAMYLRRFERQQETGSNRMSIREIRNTVQTAGFESAREIAEWLNRAFGPRSADLYRALTAARKAVRGQPMRGENYLILAQVGFLAGLSETEEEHLVAQAVRLRPHSAGVLFVSGLFLIDKGDIEGAIEKWRTAFQKDRHIRSLIISSLVPNLGAAEILEKLSPDHTGLRSLFDAYGAEKRTEDQKTVAAWYARKFERMLQDPHVNRDRNFWLTGHQMLKFNGHEKLALYCLSQAAQAAPHDFALRRSLGLELFRHEQFDDALRELKWCRLKTPDDTKINEAIKQISNKHRSRGES